MTMINNLRDRTETYLYKQGITSAAIREILRNQVFLTVGGMVAGTLLFWISSWPVLFAAGAALVTYNFYCLAKVAHQIVSQKYSKTLLFSLLFRFYGRLLLTGFVLFGLIVWLKVSIAPLAAGLSSVVASIVLWGGAHVFEQKVKEA